MNSLIKLVSFTQTVLAQGSEPNPPTWVDSVKIFKPDGNMT